jgi:hypothetical protein
MPNLSGFLSQVAQEIYLAVDHSHFCQDGSHVKLACMRNGTQSSPALQQSAAEVMQVPCV